MDEYNIFFLIGMMSLSSVDNTLYDSVSVLDGLETILYWRDFVVKFVINI